MSLLLKGKKGQKGFTLVELMVVIAILAVVSAVAVPTYTNQTKKAYRSDAKSSLMQLASAVERFRTVQNTYTGTESGGIPLATLFPSQAPLDSSQKLYDLRIQVDPTELGSTGGASYRLMATPIIGTRMAGDRSYRIYSTGLKQHQIGGTWSNGWDD